MQLNTLDAGRYIPQDSYYYDVRMRNNCYADDLVTISTSKGWRCILFLRYIQSPTVDGLQSFYGESGRVDRDRQTVHPCILPSSKPHQGRAKSTLGHETVQCNAALCIASMQLITCPDVPPTPVIRCISDSVC